MWLFPNDQQNLELHKWFLVLLVLSNNYVEIWLYDNLYERKEMKKLEEKNLVNTPTFWFMFRKWFYNSWKYNKVNEFFRLKNIDYSVYGWLKPKLSKLSDVPTLSPSFLRPLLLGTSWLT